MKRVVVPELLNSDTGTAREVEDSLKDLQMIRYQLLFLSRVSRPTLAGRYRIFFRNRGRRSAGFLNNGSRFSSLEKCRPMDTR